jgi:hypothetical protein
MSSHFSKSSGHGKGDILSEKTKSSEKPSRKGSLDSAVDFLIQQANERIVVLNPDFTIV